ncbi:uncharacterized protein Dana_GF20341, isoform C [Drosophila ananassae]|uniref:General transcription factor IIH subunit 3 n=1 Tax=Drosophila ananassae TaxID=7217 RepID=B3MPZ0_DROAN|nr:uncharacterized protein LOC6503050 isoform X2 [Drosophila ananassae]EDV44416.2 uncharacterized protein Dana_GF20341, isoform C [Drosophila ananassae]
MEPSPNNVFDKLQLLKGKEDHKWMATKPMKAALKANGRPLYRSSYKKVRMVTRVKEYQVFIIDQGSSKKFVVKDLNFFIHLMDSLNCFDNSYLISRTERKLIIFGAPNPLVDMNHFKTLKGLLMKFLSFFITPPMERYLFYYPEKPPGDNRVWCICHRFPLRIGMVCSYCYTVYCNYQYVCAHCRTCFKTLGSNMRRN